MTTGRRRKTGPGAFLGETGMKFIAPGTGPSPRARIRLGAYSISLPSPRGNATAPTDGTRARGALGSPRSKSSYPLAEHQTLSCRENMAKPTVSPALGKAWLCHPQNFCVSVSLSRWRLGKRAHSVAVTGEHMGQTQATGTAPLTLPQTLPLILYRHTGLGKRQQPHPSAHHSSKSTHTPQLQESPVLPALTELEMRSRCGYFLWMLLLLSLP